MAFPRHRFGIRSKDSFESQKAHTCADASDNIFDHCFSRSSEPTTPIAAISIAVDEEANLDPRNNASATLRIFTRAEIARLTVDPGPQRLPVLRNESASIIIKADDHTILPLHLLLRSHNNGMSYIASLDFVASCNTSGTTSSSQTFAQ